MEQYITTTNGSDVQRVEFLMMDHEVVYLSRQELRARCQELDQIARAALLRGLAVKKYRDNTRFASVLVIARQAEEL